MGFADQVEVDFKDIARVVRLVFGNEAKSRRTVKIQGRDTYHVADYWDGGSRNECRFLELGSMRVLSSEDIPQENRQVAGNVFNLPIADVKLNDGYCVVEHCIFRGKSLGYRIYVSKNVFKAFQDPSMLSLAEKFSQQTSETMAPPIKALLNESNKQEDDNNNNNNNNNNNSASEGH